MQILHFRPDYVGYRLYSGRPYSRRCGDPRVDVRNICRCGANLNILDAIKQAAAKGTA
jgi:hypothetical protein